MLKLQLSGIGAIQAVVQPPARKAYGLEGWPQMAIHK